MPNDQQAYESWLHSQELKGRKIHHEGQAMHTKDTKNKEHMINRPELFQVTITFGNFTDKQKAQAFADSLILEHNLALKTSVNIRGSFH